MAELPFEGARGQLVLCEWLHTENHVTGNHGNLPRLHSQSLQWAHGSLLRNVFANRGIGSASCSLKNLNNILTNLMVTLILISMKTFEQRI